MSLYVIGCDLSLTGTGLAYGSGPEPGISVLRPKTVGVRRMLWIRDEILKLVAAGGGRPEDLLVLLEGFAFSRPEHAHDLGGLGWIVRAGLYGAGIPWVTVAPGTLKTFVTGNGSSKKVAMVSAMTHRVGREFSSDDAVDALGLWCLGREMAGLSHPMGRLPQTHLRALGKVLRPALEDL